MFDRIEDEPAVVACHDPEFESAAGDFLVNAPFHDWFEGAHPSADLLADSVLLWLEIAENADPGGEHLWGRPEPGIRDAGVDDLPALASIQLDAMQGVWRDWVPAAALDVLKIDDGIRAWARRICADDSFTILYTHEKAGAVGLVNGQFHPAAAGPKTGHLASLYVRPGHQGKGVGGALLRETVRRFRNAGAGAMTLTCLAGTRAQDFYRKLGGEVIETTQGRFAGRGYSVVTYVWQELASLATRSACRKRLQL